MTSDFLTGLGSELSVVGIRGRLRRRIISEFADHLACDPAASLGEPRALARQFADEVGTARARRAAISGFAALALAGTLFGLAFLTSGNAAFGAEPVGAPVIAAIATVIAILFAQIACVAGTLAVLRWMARGGSGVLAAAEATMIVRRVVVGVLSGVVTMAALGVIAIADRHFLDGSWVTFAIVAAVVGIAALIASLPAIWGAARVRPVASGDAGDIFEDLAGAVALVPAPLRGRPWRFAVTVSVLVAAAITVSAVPAQDAYDGLLRGLADALACLAGFATLGRYLGLWRPGRAPIADR
jgi:hypothetical protein